MKIYTLVNYCPLLIVLKSVFGGNFHQKCANFTKRHKNAFWRLTWFQPIKQLLIRRRLVRVSFAIHIVPIIKNPLRSKFRPRKRHRILRRASLEEDFTVCMPRLH